MKNEMVFILSFYNEKVSQMIVNKYGVEPLSALRKFLFSETYRMLTDVELEMWDFSPFGIFDMWEAEQITGDPRNSLYLRRGIILNDWKMLLRILTGLLRKKERD